MKLTHLKNRISLNNSAFIRRLKGIERPPIKILFCSGFIDSAFSRRCDIKSFFKEPPNYIKYPVTFQGERVRILDLDGNYQQIKTRRGRVLRGDSILAENFVC